MEKRQLNLNAPLISVRRISSPSHSGELAIRKFTERPLPPSRQQSLPPNLSGYEYEVTKSVAVPFHWEQIPGRAKGETPARTSEELSSTPRLPPGRLSETIRRYSGETPRLPPRWVASSFSGEARYNDRKIHRSQVEAFSSNDHAKLLEKLNDSLKCNNESDSESEGDDVYSDALDMLSPTESWSLNYSVSGLSGYNITGDKPSGTFSIDTQTRDLMMNRFLHASKAAVIETPHYAVKKSPIINEHLKKPVLGERKKVEGYGLLTLPYYGQDKDSVGSEDADEELSRVPEKKTGKTWGSILPKFCRKNVLCRLNPLPVLKAKMQTPTRSTGEIRRLTRNAHSGPLDKKASPVPQKKKFHSGLLSRDLPELQNKLTNDPDQLINARDAYSLRCNRRSGSISPYRNETPKSPFREGAGFLGVPRELENHNDNKIASSRKFFKALQDVSRNQIERENAMEKTVYVDSVKKIEFPVLKSPLRKGEEKEIPCLFKEKKVSPKFGRVSDLVENSKFKWSCDQEFKSSEYKEVRLYIKVEEKDECGEELDDKREFDSTLLKSPLPPPLPKSPSESWLWRTLPLISLGNPFSPSRRSKKDGQKDSTIDSKWETIVKTSNVRHDHVRYSQELIPHVSRRYTK